MSELPPVFVLRVFTDEAGEHGNALGVLVGTAGMASSDCQAIAARLGFSETVFVDDARSAACRIFTPAVELGFAGHPMVGTAWLLSHLGAETRLLHPPAGPVACGRDSENWWVVARAEWCPKWRFRQLDSAQSVEDALPASQPAAEVVWAWLDETSGMVRARVFASALGVEEDEATGSAALPLAAALGRPITVIQGGGSRLVAAPTGEGEAKVGGLVSLDRQERLPPEGG